MPFNIQSIAEAARASPRAHGRPQTETVYNPIEAQRQAAAQRLDVYREYQSNIRKSGMLRADIVKGATAGTDTKTLLMMACECIGCMTGDDSFSRTVTKYLKESGGKTWSSATQSSE